MRYTAAYASPLGNILLASDGESLTGLWFAGQKYFAAGLEIGHTEKDLPVFRDAARWLDVYFSGDIPAFTPPLRLTGTPFQKAVWEALLTIPYGATATYGEIARRLSETKARPGTSPRAAGGAVGRNKISLIVPCHRVLGKGGSLTGYAGGLDRKAALLKLEGAL